MDLRNEKFGPCAFYLALSIFVLIMLKNFSDGVERVNRDYESLALSLNIPRQVPDNLGVQFLMNTVADWKAKFPFLGPSVGRPGLY